MTEDQKLNMLRVMIGETSKTKHPEEDNTLSAYLMLAGAKVLERLFPYVEDYTELPGGKVYDENGEVVQVNPYPVPEKYELIQLKIATYMLNKRGAEGEIQHIENGIHRNYGDADIPEALLSGIAPFVGVPKRAVEA